MHLSLLSLSAYRSDFIFSKHRTSCSTFQQQYAAYSLEKNKSFFCGCSFHGPVKWALSLPDWSSGTPVPIAPVTPHGEDVLPAISPQPARQQCRDALTKHTDVKYRTRGRHPCGALAWHHCHWPTLRSQKCEPLGTVWGQSVGVDKDYSLRHIVFLLHLCLQGRASLSLTLCYWYNTSEQRRGSSAASLLRCWPKEPTLAAFVSRCSRCLALCKKIWRMCTLWQNCRVTRRSSKTAPFWPSTEKTQSLAGSGRLELMRYYEQRWQLANICTFGI